MQNLLDVKFEQFVEDFHLQRNLKDANWKRFVNYHFFSQFQPGRFDTDADLLDQICVDSREFPQVHGAFFLLNEQILSEAQDIEDILQKDQKGILELYFMTFGDPDHLIQQLEQLFQHLETVEKKEPWLDILAYAMAKKVILRWKDNPILRIVSFGDAKTTKRKFNAIFKNNFSAIDFIRIDNEKLLDIVNSNENSYQAELDCHTTWLIPGGNERLGNAYIACLPANKLVKLMTTSDGLLRRNMFDDNVRDSQGNSTVNQEILSTLKEYPDRFVLFNNGITIVCKNVQTQDRKYILENPQIVNGCQTCTMIYQAYRRNVNLEDVQVIAKIVGSNEEITQGIVRGANRQNIVYEEAFETIRSFHKNLEKYFESMQIEGYQKIYYERRSRQYADNVKIKPQQKISFRNLIKSMVALFLYHVEDSHKHEYTLLKDYKNNLFIDAHSYQPYYLAALLYLNVEELFQAEILPKDLKAFKMHIMLLIKDMLGGHSPDLASDNIVQYCEQLLAALTRNSLNKCAAEACEKFDDIRIKWIRSKGEQYKSGIKDSAEFRSFLMKELYGAPDERDMEKLYTGNVVHVDLDRKGNLFGFIEHMPNNIFFHEFDNPDMDPSYIGKKVSYKIVRNSDQERAINVRLIKS